MLITYVFLPHQIKQTNKQAYYSVWVFVEPSGHGYGRCIQNMSIGFFKQTRRLIVRISMYKGGAGILGASYVSHHFYNLFALVHLQWLNTSSFKAQISCGVSVREHKHSAQKISLTEQKVNINFLMEFCISDYT